MKILIVFPGLHLDVDEGSKHRLNCYINEYKKKGDNVTVLAFCRSGLFVKNRKQYLNTNAKWFLLPYILPISKFFILSKILEFYLAFVLFVVTWLNKYDVVQMEIQNIKNRFCRKALYITDIHGDAVYEELESERASKKWFVQYLVYLQKKIIKNSDYCILVTENLKKQIQKNTKLPINNYSIISCGVDFERFAVTPKASIHINLSNRIVIGYSGGLQAWQNFDKMIDLVIKLRNFMPEIFFMVYTNNQIDEYKNKLDELGKDNYLIMGLKSADIPYYLKLFDVGLLLRDNKILNKVSSPTKICEYLTAGVPLICTRYSGDYSRSVKQLETGFVTEETNISKNELNQLLNLLKDIKKRREYYYAKCQEVASYRTFTSEFECFYQVIEKYLLK